MNIRCSGCGAKIQTENINEPGYISKDVYLKHKDGDFYCKRCFDLKHYNKNIVFDVSDDEYEKNIKEILKGKGLIVYIVDAFDLDGTFIGNINEMFKNDNILLVLNKIDLFLNSLNREKLSQYIRRFIKDAGLKVIDLFMMSSLKDDDIDLLIEKIKSIKDDNPRLKRKNVYFVGMTNVGKSTIINKIIKKYQNIDDLITVSNNVNTTLSNIYIPFDEYSYLVDTPGLINKGSLIYYLDNESYKAITPRGYIKPKTFQLNVGQTLFIAGFVRIDYLGDDSANDDHKKASFITNFSNDLLIHRTKMVNADSFYENHLDDILKYPNEMERVKLGKIKSDVISFNLDKKIDISIFGIGYVSIYGEGKVRISTFENIKWKERNAII